MYNIKIYNESKNKITKQKEEVPEINMHLTCNKRIQDKVDEKD